MDDKSFISAIVKKAAPGDKEEAPEEGGSSDGLTAAAEDVLAAVSSKDAGALAEALKAFFDLADAEPHEEGEHTDEEE